MTSSRLVDADHLDCLLEEFGPEGLQDLLLSFWDDAAELTARAQAGLNRSDHEGIVRVLHTLAGAAANLGLTGCRRACADLKGAVAADDPSRTSQAMAELLASVPATRRALDSTLARKTQAAV